MGQDPTAELLPAGDPDIAQVRRDAAAYISMHEDFPTYIVTMGGTDARRWITVGMLWSSISLIGRGTVIWLVRELVDDSYGAFLIMEIIVAQQDAHTRI